MTTTNTQVPLSPTGAFDYAGLASGRRFDASEIVHATPVLGLQREAGYIWGTLRDDEGTLYTVMRRISATPPTATDDGRQSLGGRLLVTASNTGQDGLYLRKEPRYAVDSALITAELAGDDTAVFSSPAGAPGEPMRLVLDPDNFSYTENGVIEATGTMLTPPAQWFLPGGRDAALLYLTQTWFVDAEILGRPARGFLFWEEAWMPPGGRLYREKDPLHDTQYLTWYSWANHWDDGSCEIGHFLFGNHQFHIGLTSHSNGTVRSASSMDAVITRSADGYWHDGIDYEIDGVQWRCEPDEHGQMRGLGLSMPNPQQEGRMHRVDDRRIPDVWMAWGETVPATGVVRSH